VHLAYGDTGLDDELPTDRTTVVEPRHTPGAVDPATLLRERLRNPVSGPPLREVVRPGQRVATSMCDGTRAQPRDLMIPAVLDAGLRRASSRPARHTGADHQHDQSRRVSDKVGRFDDKVVFVSGGAKGQCRSHAVRFAEEGADVVLTDACSDFAAVPYDLGTSADLKETVAMVEATGRRAVAGEGDVRNLTDAEAAVAVGVAEVSGGNHPYPEPRTEASGITNAMPFLASEETHYITGAVLPIDLGELAK